MDLSGQRRRRRQRRVEISIVPMIDVMMTLIFFFLITMQFKEIRSVEITPPSMTTSDKASAEKNYVIGVSKDGEYFYGDSKVTVEELAIALKKLAEENDSPAVVLLADKDVPLHFATGAIDAVRMAKIRKLSIQSQ